jgi:hypothetical protein
MKRRINFSLRLLCGAFLVAGLFFIMLEVFIQFLAWHFEQPI